MTVEALIPTLLSAVILLVCVVMGPLLARKPAQIADLRYAIFLARGPARAFVALLLLGTLAVNALFGIGFLTTGRPIGWAFALLALVPLVILGYLVYVARLPFQPPTER